MTEVLLRSFQFVEKFKKEQYIIKIRRRRKRSELARDASEQSLLSEKPQVFRQSQMTEVKLRSFLICNAVKVYALDIFQNGRCYFNYFSSLAGIEAVLNFIYGNGWRNSAVGKSDLFNMELYPILRESAYKPHCSSLAFTTADIKIAHITKELKIFSELRNIVVSGSDPYKLIVFF